MTIRITKGFVLGSWLLLTVLSLFSRLTLAESASSDEEAKRLRSVSVLLSPIKAISDTGKLDDVDTVSKHLDMSFTSRTRDDDIAQPPECADPTDDRHRVVTDFFPIKNNWFKAESIEVSSRETPPTSAARQLKVGEASQPELEFATIRIAHCGEVESSTDAVFITSLVFKNLSTYACITRHDIEEYFPDAEYNEGSENYYGYRYVGRTDSDSGAIATFAFIWPSGCARQIAIDQSKNID